MYNIKLEGKKQKLGFSSAHIIPNHAKCGKIHGHNYFIDIKAEGNLNSDNQVIDFGTIKNHVRKICQKLDHKMLLASKNENSKIKDLGDNINIKIDKKEYNIPKEDIELLPLTNITAEELSRYIAKILTPQIESNIKSIYIFITRQKFYAVTEELFRFLRKCV